jgi:hypothetical protein
MKASDPKSGVSLPLRTMERTMFCMSGEWFVFKSEHPLEERIVMLTDDYRAPDGSWILPEAVAWDGVTGDW